MKVINLRTYTGKEKCVYIGRPANLGNPYRISPSTDRGRAIQLFEEYARRTPRVLDEIYKLPENAVLSCWCAPEPCHGDVIIKLWKEMHHATI